MDQVTGQALTLEEAKARFELALALNEEREHAGFFSVKLKSDQSFMGIAKFAYLSPSQVEVGYGSLPPFWNKGYASEMLASLIDHARQQTEIKELIGIVHPKNAASIHVLKKFNFSKYSKPDQIESVNHYCLKL
jgi:RimJ/RimL family protein N-acetyltransferase